MVTDTRDRAQGVLIGLAAGDRNGGPIRMAILLAESLANKREFDRDDVFERYLAWWQQGGFDTGPTSGKFFELVGSGIPRDQAISRVHTASGGLTAGCNPSHRSPPLAMAPFLPDDQIPNLARQEAALTHHDPLAGDVAASVVLLCRSLIRGYSWGDACQRAAQGPTNLTKAAFQTISDESLKWDGFAPAVLRAAIHFIQTSTSFDAALTAAIEFAGPPNYCPVLVGAIGGARWGSAAIHAKHLSHCDILPRVYASAKALAAGWNNERDE